MVFARIDNPQRLAPCCDRCAISVSKGTYARLPQEESTGHLRFLMKKRLLLKINDLIHEATTTQMTHGDVLDVLDNVTVDLIHKI